MTLKKEKLFFFFRAETSGTFTRKLREQKGRMAQLNWWESTSCRCTTSGLSGTKSVQHFQTRRQQMTLAPSCPLTYPKFGRGQVKNNMMWSSLIAAWYLLIYCCSVSTCSHLGQKRNIKKTLRQKAEWTSVLKDTRSWQYLCPEAAMHKK